jgi:carbamoylphosphate synthase large subunit
MAEPDDFESFLRREKEKQRKAAKSFVRKVTKLPRARTPTMSAEAAEQVLIALPTILRPIVDEVSHIVGSEQEYEELVARVQQQQQMPEILIRTYIDAIFTAAYARLHRGQA